MDNLTGTVLAVQANYYRVRLDRALDPNCEAICSELLCIRRARLKKTGQHVYVGDRVALEEPDWQGQRAAISSVAPRQNLLDRPMVANIDRVLLVFAFTEPELEPFQLSRFLVKVESLGLEVSLCLNKRDLVSAEFAQTCCARIAAWGYKAIALSTETGEGIDALKSHLSHGITAISGPSGVGKSSLINILIPELNLRVGEVSQRQGHGRHTTRHVELFNFGDDGLIADTPGYLQPAITCNPTSLIECFPEAVDILASDRCQFHDCLHQDELGCVVRGAWERYPHYILFLEEVLAHAAKQQMIATPDRNTKSKSVSGGAEQQEPRLAPKRYRRTSRRHEHQNLDTDYQDSDDL